MKTLGILALIVILVGVLFLWSRGGNEPVPGEIPPNNTSSGTTEEPDGERVTLQTEESVINWKGSKTLIANYEDNGTVNFKEGYLIESNGSVVGGTFVVDMTTIAAKSTGRGDGEDMLSNHLKSADFFDVAAYPESTLVITNVEERSDLAAENSTHLATGDLTVKGITNTISFPARIVRTETGAWEVDAMFDLDRTDWNVRYGSGSFFDNLGDNVIDDIMTLSVHLVAEA